MSDMMDRARAILEVYGADSARWPEGERRDLLAFFEATPAAEALLQDARELDALLEKDPAPAAPAMLKENLMADAARELADLGQIKPAEQGLLASLLASLAAMVRAPQGFRLGVSIPATSSLLATVLALGLWFGSTLVVEPLAEDELLAAFGEDYGVWPEDDLIETSGERL